MSLLYRVFFCLSIILAMCGEKHCQLKKKFTNLNPMEIMAYNFFNTSKNNQHSSRWSGSYYFNIWYRTTHAERNKLDKFMQKIGLETQIDIHIKLLSKHSGRKTATQIKKFLNKL